MTILLRGIVMEHIFKFGFVVKSFLNDLNFDTFKYITEKHKYLGSLGLEDTSKSSNEIKLTPTCK